MQGAAPALQPPGAVLGIRLIYAGLPCGLWIIAMFALTRYGLTEAKFNDLKAQILSRQEGAAQPF